MQSSIEARLSLCRLHRQHGHCWQDIFWDAIAILSPCDPLRNSSSLTTVYSLTIMQFPGVRENWAGPQTGTSHGHYITACLGTVTAIRGREQHAKGCVQMGGCAALRSTGWCDHLAAASRGGKASS